MANQLLEKVWEAHGGFDRWKSFEMVHATIVSSGQLWDMKHTPQDSCFVWIHEQLAWSTYATCHASLMVGVLAVLGANHTRFGGRPKH